MKPLLIGMNNPYGGDPEYALYPAPEGCTGHRLWAIINDVTPLFRKDYADNFARMNLVVGPWDKARARAAAAALVDGGTLRGRTTCLLGLDVQRAFGVSGPPLTEMWIQGTAKLVLVPHPSGRNPWYNDPHNRMKVGLLLAKLYDVGRENSKL